MLDRLISINDRIPLSPCVSLSHSILDHLTDYQTFIYFFSEFLFLVLRVRVRAYFADRDPMQQTA
jgi:hypothetical protein